MQLQINSTNINTFIVNVTFNVYQRTVTFDTSPTIYNNSGGANVLGISFSLIDQSGVELADGGINFTSPQIQGPITSGNWIWTLDLSAVNFAFLFQTYQITCAIQDYNGTIYTIPPAFATLCEPNNITDSGYVPGIFQITPDTVNSVLTVKELTQLVYNNTVPTSVSKSGTLYYPTGTISPLTFTNTPFTNNVIYTGQYNIQCTTIGTYSLGNGIYVNVTYITNNVFPVTVGNTISNVLCCIMQVQATARKNCDNAIGENARQQLYDILPYVVVGIAKETSGQDSTWEAEYIQKYLSCNCGNASQNQSEFTPINPAVTSIVLQGVGGTTVPSPTTTGNTTTYSIQSSIYSVAKGVPSDLAFTIATNPNAGANNVQYLITINYAVFASSILTAISLSPTLLNQLNSLITVGGFSAAGLNGQCIINLTQINYVLSYQGVNNTLITNIVINGNIYNAPANLFINTPILVSNWLNSLTLGTFTVSFSNNVITITSNSNTNVISTMTFGNPTTTQIFQSTSASLNQVLQAIFNYVCNITALQVALGNTLSLCTFSYNGQIVDTGYASTSSQGSFNSGVAAAICNIANRINSLTSITCGILQGIFNAYPNAVMNPATDWFMSVVGGNCTQLTPVQAGFGIVAAVNSNTALKAAWCAIDCATPGTCPDIQANNLGNLSDMSFGVYGVTFATPTTNGQILTVKYQLAGASSWITATNNLAVFSNGNVSGTSPFVISGLTPGATYNVWITNNCGGNGFVSQITVPSATLYTGQFLLDNIIYNICGDGAVTLYSSLPFGTGVKMYTNSSLTTPVTGYLYIAQVTSGNIYQINNSTGVVGNNTGSSCNNGTLGSYILGNSTGSICSGSPASLYTNGTFNVGSILYQDSGLTTPVTGYSFVVQLSSNNIYNLNSVSGAIGSSTGLSCSTNTVNITSDMAGVVLTNVIGISGFTPSPAFPLNTGGTVVGTHGAFTGTIACVVTGTPVINPSGLALYKNGVLAQCINVTGAGTYTFSSLSYLASDVINLALQIGSC